MWNGKEGMWLQSRDGRIEISGAGRDETNVNIEQWYKYSLRGESGKNLQ
jgi:hypothetical protein